MYYVTGVPIFVQHPKLKNSNILLEFNHSWIKKSENKGRTAFKILSIIKYIDLMTNQKIILSVIILPVTWMYLLNVSRNNISIAYTVDFIAYHGIV